MTRAQDNPRVQASDRQEPRKLEELCLPWKGADWFTSFRSEQRLDGGPLLQNDHERTRAFLSFSMPTRWKDRFSLHRKVTDLTKVLMSEKVCTRTRGTTVSIYSGQGNGRKLYGEPTVSYSAMVYFCGVEGKIDSAETWLERVMQVQVSTVTREATPSSG